MNGNVVAYIITYTYQTFYIPTSLGTAAFLKRVSNFQLHDLDPNRALLKMPSKTKSVTMRAVQ